MILPIQFIQNPYASNYSGLKNSTLFIISFFWLLSSLFIIGFLTQILQAIYSIYSIEVSIADFNVAVKEYIGKNGYLKSLLIIGILGPVLEELAFRYSLSLTKKSISIGLSVFIAITFISFSPLKVELLTNYIFGSILFLLSYFTINFLLTDNTIHLLRNKYANIILYLSSIVFALYHLGNIDNIEFIELPFYLVSIIFLFALGLFTSFLRIKVSFFAGCLLHILWNSLGVLFI